MMLKKDDVVVFTDASKYGTIGIVILKYVIEWYMIKCTDSDYEFTLKHFTDIKKIGVL